MQPTDYHQRIIDYYKVSENSYKDAWDLKHSFAIHYGYWDETVRSFRQSLAKMNEVMAITAQIKPTDTVLDAGCGVGGSSIFLANWIGCRVTGITLSEDQGQQAIENAKKKNVESLVDFRVMDYCATNCPDESFDVVWGCESICYADDKQKFIQEAYRLLKPGGRLVVADGFITKFENNEHPIIRQWLDGWQVNYLETLERFCSFMQQTGFSNILYRDISTYTANSSGRLYRFYYLASLYMWWKKMFFHRRFSDMQKKNVAACKYQHLGMNKKLWQYGLVVGMKP
jgi:cyclopropane fatty-acyl-phospholipid synthase-like methyltransferase